MDVMDDTMGPVETMADELQEKRITKRKERAPHHGEPSNSSYNLENFSNDSQIISISVPEGQPRNTSVPIELDQLVKDSNGYVQTIKRELHVSRDHSTGNTVISIVDGGKRDVIRHIPQDKTLTVEGLITAPAGMLFVATA